MVAFTKITLLLGKLLKRRWALPVSSAHHPICMWFLQTWQPSFWNCSFLRQLRSVSFSFTPSFIAWSVTLLGEFALLSFYSFFLGRLASNSSLPHSHFFLLSLWHIRFCGGLLLLNSVSQKSCKAAIKVWTRASFLLYHGTSFKGRWFFTKFDSLWL